MGDCEIMIKESKEKPSEACSALSQEVEFSQKIKSSKQTTAEDSFLDCDSELKAGISQKKETEQLDKCYSFGGYSGRSGGADYFGTLGRDVGRFVGGSLMALTFGPPAMGYAVARSLDSVCSGGGYKANQLDLGWKDCDDKLDWNQKEFDKKLFIDKQYAKDLDFSPIPTLSPIACRIIDRVDTNGDGSMTVNEINSALNGDVLNDKEKSMLELIKKSKNLIDNDRDGVSLRDVKDFDSKVIQYQKELAVARKFAPELADFARELHQKGKLADENHDGRFSKDELISFYIDCKKEFSINQTEEGKRDLAALNWGITNYSRYSLMTGRPGGGQINPEFLETQLLREMDQVMPAEQRQEFLSQSDRLRVERYQNSLNP